jgi:hypothetical protein
LSDQEIAGRIGSPLCRSQTASVFRWVVIAIPLIREISEGATATIAPQTARHWAQISFKSCSSHPNLGKNCLILLYSDATIHPSGFTNMARMPVLPTSIDNIIRKGQLMPAKKRVSPGMARLEVLQQNTHVSMSKSFFTSSGGTFPNFFFLISNF